MNQVRLKPAEVIESKLAAPINQLKLVANTGRLKPTSPAGQATIAPAQTIIPDSAGEIFVNALTCPIRRALL